MTEEQRIKHNEWQRKYREKYPERVKATQLKYRLTHRDEINKRCKKYRRGSESSYNEYRRRKNQESIDNCDESLRRARWSEKEIDFLVDNYDHMTITEISLELGRTICAVERKRNMLGLHKPDVEVEN